MRKPLVTRTLRKTRAAKSKSRLKALDSKFRRKIIGGKSVARFLNFTQQRIVQIETKEKQPTLVPSRRLVSSSETSPKHGRQTRASTPSVVNAYKAKEDVDKTDVKSVWRPLGPFCIPHGQTLGAGPGCRPSVSGRVSAIAVDPRNPNHILIGSGGGGGLWETTNGGIEWIPQIDDQPSLSIGAIAFSPSDSSFVYAGTGDADSTCVDAETILGVGLFRSQDGGTTWSHIWPTRFEKTGFYDLAVDPLNPKKLVAATTEGLFQSTDGGENWNPLREIRTWDLSIHPSIPTELFAGCADGVFRSIDGGITWARVKLPGGRKHYERIEVCHAPSDGNVVYIFATATNLSDPNKDPTPFLWRRSVFDGSFERIDKLPKDLVTEQSWYDWFAAVAPNNPDVLYIGALDAHKGVRSASGTWRWENISAKKFGNSIHADMHSIAFSPIDPSVVYIGSDGGIFRSHNAGGDWVSLNKGLCLAEVDFLAQHPQFESWLIAGTQDNGTLLYHGDIVWYHISDGDGGDCGVSSTFPYTCYVSFFGMGVARSKKGGGWNTWPSNPLLIGPPLISRDDYPDGSLFYPPLEVNGRTVVQAGRKVCISTNRGETWVKVKPPFKTDELSSALCVPTPRQIFVGTTTGRIFRLDATAKSWRQTELSHPPVVGNISDILIDPTNPDRIYLTLTSSNTGRHVFRSDDGGNTWHDISAKLPNIAVNAIEIDPENHETIFIGADVGGVFRSKNAGKSWAQFNPELPNVLVKALSLHQPSRLLRAGTSARGVWEIPIDEEALRPVDVYLRDNSADTGRETPSPFGVSDPFNFGTEAFWWQCVDIKVDSSSAHTPMLDDVDFEIFGDDQSMIGVDEGDLGIQFAAGLLHENPQRNQLVRVFVRVNNRGTSKATNAIVKVFFAATTSTVFPNLPGNFWKNFPDNKVSSSSAWQPVSSHKVIPLIEAGSSKIVGFEWLVPATAPENIGLLAIISADKDSINTDELNIQRLITGNKKCGLRNVTIINPLPDNAPVVRSVQLDFSGPGGSQKCSLVSAQSTPPVLRAVMLSKRLSRLAKKHKLKRTKLTPQDKLELTRLIESMPSLQKKLDLKAVFVPSRGELFEPLRLSPSSSEPLIFFINPKVKSGAASIMQVAEDKTVVGGHTFQALGLERS